MVSNRLALAALGFATASAAAAGGYIATRHNATIETPASATVSIAPDPATQPVASTETLVEQDAPPPVEAHAEALPQKRSPAKAARNAAPVTSSRPVEAARSPSVPPAPSSPPATF